MINMSKIVWPLAGAYHRGGLSNNNNNNNDNNNNGNSVLLHTINYIQLKD